MKITIIDLNNFSYYPTLSIGYLISILRKSNYQVSLLSPLNNGVGARRREKIENKLDLWKSLIRNADLVLLKRLFAILKKFPIIYNTYLKKGPIYKILKKRIALDTDLVLISTYFENYYICKKLGIYLKKLGIPVIVGGPGFNNSKVANEWLKLQGIEIIVGVEVDKFLPNLINDFFDHKDLNNYPGIYTKNNLNPDNSYIFSDLKELPIPDFSDFPWQKYPMKIIPYMTGRGCGWGKCNFCTDVKYVNGRSFRTIRPEKVLNDLKILCEANNTNLVYFSDLKLNSDLKVWKSIITNIPKFINNPIWFATVHVGNAKENGLDRKSLFRAKESGLTRLSFGLESGSQRLLDHMRKGTDIDRIETFLHDVHEAGISLRATMFIGYPYENEEDLKLTYLFLKRNSHCFDRINLSKFQLFEMAPIFQKVKDDLANVKLIFTKHTHHISMLTSRGRNYNNYRNKIIKEVFRINSKPILKEAVMFDGIM